MIPGNTLAGGNNPQLTVTTTTNGDAGVLDVDVVETLGVGAVLVGGDAGHDGLGGSKRFRAPWFVSI